MRWLALLLLCAKTMSAQWQIQDSHSTGDLRGINYVGNGVAWASGSNGTVLRTVDMGRTWEHCSTPPGGAQLDLRGIQAFDSDTAVVMSSGIGDQSRLYKTTDGCRTWSLSIANPARDGFWDALQIAHDGDGGVLIGNPVDGNFVIYETHNKGDSWEIWETNKYHNLSAEKVQPAKSRPGEVLLGVGNGVADLLGRNMFCFVASGREGAFLYASEPHDPFDNGTTWKFNSIKLPFNSRRILGASSIADRVINANRGWFDLMVVGGDDQTPNAVGVAVYLPHRIEKSIGNLLALGPERQRIISAQAPPNGYRSAVAFDEQSKIWITVGPNGTDISTDDGLNWHALKPSASDSVDADRSWTSLSLPFVVGPHGHIGLLEQSALKH